MFGFLDKKKDVTVNAQTSFEKERRVVKDVFGENVFKDTPDPDISKKAINKLKEHSDLSLQEGMRILGIDYLLVVNLEKAEKVRKLLTGV